MFSWPGFKRGVSKSQIKWVFIHLSALTDFSLDGIQVLLRGYVGYLGLAMRGSPRGTDFAGRSRTFPVRGTAWTGPEFAPG